MEIAASLLIFPKRPPPNDDDDDDTEEDSEGERAWYKQANQASSHTTAPDDFSDMDDPLFRALLQSMMKPEKEQNSSKANLNQDVKDEEYNVEDKKEDLVNDKKMDLIPPWRENEPVPVPPPVPPTEPPSYPRVRGHASRESEGRFWEMFVSRREYERLVRNKNRSRRGYSYWHRQQQHW